MAQSYIQTEDYTPDNLIAGDQKNLPTEQIILKMGENLERGTVLGKIDRFIKHYMPNPGNEGNGVFGGEPSMTQKTKKGFYYIIMLTATTFSFFDPDGNRLKDGSTGVAYVCPQLSFKLEVGGIPFVAGDSFEIYVTDVAEIFWVKSLAANVDGSEIPRAVLTKNTDATDENCFARAYLEGQFNRERIILGLGHTVESIKDQMRLFGIYFRPVVKA